ncbi:MAG: hypothetical protein IAF58_08460 [Leptolyngbya sp.]|nr:hypothetical protein [Candidatus Melainabacteria bacterium]
MARDTNLNDATRPGDSILGPAAISPETHLAIMDDMHKGAQSLVPDFSQFAGERQSFADASKHLSDLTIVGAGVRGQMNGSLINQLFNPTDGVSNDTAQRVDGNLEAFLNGQRATFAENVHNRLNTNNSNDPKKQAGYA